MNRNGRLIFLSLILAVGLLFLLGEHQQPASLPKNQQLMGASPDVFNSNAGALATSASKKVEDIPGSLANVPVKVTNPTLAPAGMVVSPPLADTSKIPPLIAMQNVRRAVRQYGDMFNGNPVGTNPEITAALAGANPKQINFLNPDAGMHVNDRGEMIDPWGTPYFFHQVSGTEMEIHSAGPDKVMWTADDLVTK